MPAAIRSLSREGSIVLRLAHWLGRSGSGDRGVPTTGRRAASLARPATVPTAGPARLRRAEPARLSINVAAGATALAGALAFAVLTQWGGNARQARPILDETDRLAEVAGLGLQQVSVSGQRMTPDLEIFNALAFEQARSLLRFDSSAARQQIERLPWVKGATITYVFPHSINVAVEERIPAAVWSRASGDSLIDGTGRVLGPVPAGARPDLPRVAGEGAATKAAEILAELGRYPEFASRVGAAELVEKRRWTLRINGGPDIKLPADEEPAALSKLMLLASRYDLLGPRYETVDLRFAGRVVLRPKQAGPETRPVATNATHPSG